MWKRVWRAIKPESGRVGMRNRRGSIEKEGGERGDENRRVAIRAEKDSATRRFARCTIKLRGPQTSIAFGGHWLGLTFQDPGFLGSRATIVNRFI